MKRIILIQPNYRGGYFSTISRPVGLGYIAESLRVAGIDYEVVDLNLHNEDFLYRKIEHFQPDLIGISLMTHRYKRHYKLIKEIKSKFPTIKIVAGGPHISYLREQVLKECPEIDYGVTLEGEETIIELCDGKDIHEIKGVLYRDESNIRYGGDRDLIMNLDNIPLPTYRGFELDKYPKYMHIISSRGCPYNCIFCGAWMALGRKWRARSPLSVIKEIEYWYKRGFREFGFVDSNFSMDKKRVYDFCDELEKRKLKITLSCDGIRADGVDFEVLKRMKEVGFRSLHLGVEGGNNKILKNLKKGETIEEIERAIKDACELGYNVGLFFLIGSPGETKEDVEDSFRLACKYPVSTAWFFHIIPIPKTELFDWVNTNNYFLYSPEEYLSGNFGIENIPIFFTPTLSIDDRKKLHQRARRLQKEITKKYIFKISFDIFKPKLGSLAYIGAFIASRSPFYHAWRYVPLKIKNFLKALIIEKGAGGNDWV